MIIAWYQNNITLHNLFILYKEFVLYDRYAISQVSKHIFILLQHSKHIKKHN